MMMAIVLVMAVMVVPIVSHNYRDLQARTVKVFKLLAMKKLGKHSVLFYLELMVWNPYLIY